MRYKELILIILLFFTSQAWSQDLSRSVGIKIIPSYLTIYPEYGIEAGRFGISGGVQYIHPLSAQVALETGIYILDRGSRIEFPQVDISGVLLFSDTLYTRYLFASIPVLLRVQLGNAYIFAGPSVDYLIHGFEYYEALDEKRVFGREIDEDNINRFNLGGMIGLGYQKSFRERINIFMEVNVGSTLTYIDNETPFRLANFGLGLGVNYNLIQ